MWAQDVIDLPLHHQALPNYNLMGHETEPYHSAHHKFKSNTTIFFYKIGQICSLTSVNRCAHDIPQQYRTNIQRTHAVPLIISPCFQLRCHTKYCCQMSTFRPIDASLQDTELEVAGVVPLSEWQKQMVWGSAIPSLQYNNLCFCLG